MKELTSDQALELCELSHIEALLIKWLKGWYWMALIMSLFCLIFSPVELGHRINLVIIMNIFLTLIWLVPVGIAVLIREVKIKWGK